MEVSISGAVEKNTADWLYPIVKGNCWYRLVWMRKIYVIPRETNTLACGTSTFTVSVDGMPVGWASTPKCEVRRVYMS